MLEPSHSLAILVKSNCCKVLSMTPDTLLTLFLATGNSGIRGQGQLGNLLRFKPWKNYLLKGRRGTSIRAHYPESLVCGCLAIIYVGNLGHPLNSLSSECQPTSVPSQLLSPTRSPQSKIRNRKNLSSQPTECRSFSMAYPPGCLL